MTEQPPPVPKYTLNLEITGNSHGEIVRELLIMTRGGYLHDSRYHTRDEWEVIGGRSTRRMEHTNPEQTPERYDAELEAWWSARRSIDPDADNNQADALVLAAMGADHYGTPLVELPKAHREALEKVAWPDLTVASGGAAPQGGVAGEGSVA